MAKVKGLFGTNLRGSVGGVTFRVRGGKNVASQKVSGAKKSATPAQIYQRAVGNTTMQAYAVMKAICDHSFEGVQTGALSMSHFLKINNNLLRGLGNQARFIKKGLTKKAAPVPFIISEGTLPPISLTDVGEETDFSYSTWSLDFTQRSVDEWKKMTPRIFMSELGLEPTDQISIVANMDMAGSSVYPDREAWDGSMMYCSLTRYLFDEKKFDTPMFKANPDGSDQYPLVVDDAVLDMKRSTLGNVRLTIYDKGVDNNDNILVVTPMTRTDQVMMTVGLIVSRKGSSEWLRSFCQMSVDNQAKALYAYMYDDVYPTYEHADEERILNYVEPVTSSTE